MKPHKMIKHLFLLLIASLLFTISKAQTNEQLTKIILRSIGHEFLLQINDSSSRVLPIQKEKDRYAVRFARTFSFDPEILSSVVLQLIEERKISNAYIVEVERCESTEVVYSFEANLTRDDSTISCKMRLLPEDCYVFYFTGIDPATSVSPPSANRLHYTYALIFLMLGGGAVYLNKKRRKEGIKADIINIGQYQFDQKRMTLSLKTQSIELSTKESDLLLLLFSNENKTLEREFILNQIWGDEGDYVGRTLDVYISKLRKKLEADPSLKIINVRGIGYRFVIH